MSKVKKSVIYRFTSVGAEYRIKWKGYDDPSDYTWEPINHLDGIQDLVNDFNINWAKKEAAKKGRNGDMVRKV